MTYADHQEAVSAALLRLCQVRRVPDTERDDVLQLRRQAHLAVGERLEELGRSRHPEPRGRIDRTIDAARHPLHVLSGILDALPVVEPGPLPPSVLLAAVPGDDHSVAVGHWRSVARHLFLGNHDLRASADQSWRSHASSWHLKRDLATTIEALVVVERAIAGLGDEHELRSEAYLSHRLAAGSVARIAGWRATDASSPDLTMAAPESMLGTLGGPRIHLIRRPEDFVAAQQALAGLLRPRASDVYDDEYLDRPGLVAARTVAVGQIRMAHAFGAWAERAGLSDLAQRFRSRVPRYAELHRSTRRLAELRRTTSPLAVAQQSEAVQQLSKHKDAKLDGATLHALDVASREVAVNTGKALRREALHRYNIVPLAEDLVDALDGLQPMRSRNHPFVRACAALTEQSAARHDHDVASRERRDELAVRLIGRGVVDLRASAVTSRS